jgi:hypothetical protein
MGCLLLQARPKFLKAKGVSQWVSQQFLTRGPAFCQRSAFSGQILYTVTTITAILEPHADGGIRLPVFAEIRQGKGNVTATLIPVSSDTEPAVNTLVLSSAHCGARRYQEHPRSSTMAARNPTGSFVALS